VTDGICDDARLVFLVRRHVAAEVQLVGAECSDPLHPRNVVMLCRLGITRRRRLARASRDDCRARDDDSAAGRTLVDTVSVCHVVLPPSTIVA
jgi:hypothetical protein